MLKQLVDLSHKLDPTRPAAIGGAQRGGFDVLGDIAGYNGDGAAIFHDPAFRILYLNMEVRYLTDQENLNHDIPMG